MEVTIEFQNEEQKERFMESFDDFISESKGLTYQQDGEKLFVVAEIEESTEESTEGDEEE